MNSGAVFMVNHCLNHAILTTKEVVSGDGGGSRCLNKIGQISGLTGQIPEEGVSLIIPNCGSKPGLGVNETLTLGTKHKGLVKTNKTYHQDK